MPEIIITVSNKAARASVRSIVCDNTDYTLRFVFDSQWGEGAKTVFFILQGVGALAPAVMTGDTCALPAVHLNDGVSRQLAVGVQQGTVKTTTAAYLWCYPSAENELLNSIVDDDGVTMTWLEWVNANMAAASTDVQTAQAALAAAREAAAEAAGAAQTAETKAGEAASSAMAAAESAETASEAASTATTKAGEAEASADSASGSASTASAAAQAATTKASEAAASAESASGSATTASTAAQTATTKASEAASSAESVAGSASTASTAAQTATTKASEAAASAESASGSASTASAAAQTAETKAGEAAASAESASESAETASEAASTATTKAGEAAASADSVSGSVSAASEAAQTATTKAGEAATSAESASGSASTASAAAQTAETKAGEAAASATAAAGSATTASGAASTATTKAGEVASSATAAAGSATAANEAASTATTKAGEAASSAESASGSASTANTAAQTATTKASEAAASATAAAGSATTASGAASTATTKAGEAAASADSASGSASTASGAAAAAETAAETALTGIDAQIFDATESYSAGECVIYDSVLYEFTTSHAAGAWTGTDAVAVTGNTAPLFDAAKTYAAGDYVIHNGLLYKFVAAHTAGAWTGSDARTTKIGPEIFGLKNDVTEITGNDSMPITKKNKYVNLSGATADIENPTTSTSGFCYTAIPCAPGDKFTVNVVGGTGARAYGFLGAITTGTARTVLVAAPENFAANDYLIVAPEGAEYIVINDKSGSVSYYGELARKRFDEKSPAIKRTASGSVAKFDDGAKDFPVDSLVVNIDLIQSGSGNPSLANIRSMSGWTGINVYHSDEDTENPEVIQITFPSDVGTVYGGTLDLVSGTLKVTSVVYKASDFVSYDKSSSISFDEFYFRVTNVKSPSVTSSSASTNIKCSHARSGQTANASYTQCRISNSQPRILFPAGAMTSKSAFTTWLQEQSNNGAPLQFWYTITPVTYYLTAHDVKTLLGYNSFWCDSGNTKIVYSADTQIYADQSGELPVYWKDEISTSVSSIRANQMDGAYSSPSICFITDCHWEDNKKKSPRIVKDIIDKCNIDFFVNGGDIILDYNPNGKEAAADELWSCINAFRNVGRPMITLYGNHDRNRDGNPDRDDGIHDLSRKEHLNIVYKSFWDMPGLMFYTAPGDNTWDLVYWEDRNYRYVLTYWYMQSTSRMPSALMEQMFNTSKEVVIFNHGIYFELYQNMSNDTMHGGWLLADCEPYKNQIKCFIQGHSHIDGLRWAYDGLVPIIILDCDRFRDTKSIEGTASEQCVSVITINSNSIKVVRIGRGLDFNVTSGTNPFIVQYNNYVPSIVECT